MSSYDISLERILGFSEEDLEANRQGQMTVQQVQTLNGLKRKSQWQTGLGMIPLGAMVLLWIIFSSSIWNTSWYTNNYKWLMTLCYSYPAIFAMLGVAYLAWRISKYHSDIINQDIESLDSPFRLSMFQYKYQRTFFIHLGKVKLTIPEHVHHHLQLVDSRAVYRWYYTKKSRVLLSAELLPW